MITVRGLPIYSCDSESWAASSSLVNSSGSWPGLVMISMLRGAITGFLGELTAVLRDILPSVPSSSIVSTLAKPSSISTSFIGASMMPFYSDSSKSPGCRRAVSFSAIFSRCTFYASYYLAKSVLLPLNLTAPCANTPSSCSLEILNLRVAAFFSLIFFFWLKLWEGSVFMG